MHHNTSCCPNNTTTQTLNNITATIKIFDHVITKCYNKIACGTKITVRAGDRKQEIYNWWPNINSVVVNFHERRQHFKREFHTTDV